jgi:hypothetical protein
MSEHQNGTTTGMTGTIKAGPGRYSAIRDMKVGDVLNFTRIDYSENPEPNTYNPNSLHGILSYYKLRYGMLLKMRRAKDGSATIRRLA